MGTLFKATKIYAHPKASRGPIFMIMALPDHCTGDYALNHLEYKCGIFNVPYSEFFA